MKAWGDEPLLYLDRAHISAFGVQAFGLHVNGLVRDGKRTRLWIARRAADRLVEPNKLDNLVAGGQPAGLSLTENLIKETAEEADLPQSLARQAVPVSAIRYCMETVSGFKPDTMFIYDLDLPVDFVPHNTDGEVSEFTLMDIDDVAARVRDTDDFKFNVNLVIVDLFIRLGYLTPENQPDYLEMITRLRCHY